MLIVGVWQAVAMNTIIYISGLQTVPEDVYEASMLDGASKWKQFWKVTFPLVMPFVTINLVLSTKNFLMVFDQIMSLTKGGPAQSTESISYLIYRNGMDGGQFGGRIDVGIDAVEWAMKADRLGAGEILLTSMDCDGTKAGYDLELTRMIAENVSIPVIASGGAGTKEHFYDALTEGKADAALAASLFHYKELEICDLKDYLAERGVSVRR